MEEEMAHWGLQACMEGYDWRIEERVSSAIRHSGKPELPHQSPRKRVYHHVATDGAAQAIEHVIS